MGTKGWRWDCSLPECVQEVVSGDYAQDLALSGGMSGRRNSTGSELGTHPCPPGVLRWNELPGNSMLGPPYPNTWPLPSPTLLHDLHDLHHLVHVFPSSNQPLQHQHLIVVEHIAIQATHDLGGEKKVVGIRAQCTPSQPELLPPSGQTHQTPLLPNSLSRQEASQGTQPHPDLLPFLFFFPHNLGGAQQLPLP